MIPIFVCCVKKSSLVLPGRNTTLGNSITNLLLVTHESSSLESINFYLLHLTLMREYLDLEFHEIETILPFNYTLERVIDDFILLAVFVGNDFLPHLPDVHIHENGLERLFEIYKQVLPSLGESPTTLHLDAFLTVS